MSPILKKQRLTPDIAMFEIEAPRIAKRWKAGQFVIVRPRDDSERIPLTLVMSDADRGSITLVVQAAGKTTKRMVAMEVGESLADYINHILGRSRTSYDKDYIYWCGKSRFYPQFVQRHFVCFGTPRLHSDTDGH